MISQRIIDKELFNDAWIKYYAVDIATQREMMNFGAKRRDKEYNEAIAKRERRVNVRRGLREEETRRLTNSTRGLSISLASTNLAYMASGIHSANKSAEKADERAQHKQGESNTLAKC